MKDEPKASKRFAPGSLVCKLAATYRPDEVLVRVDVLDPPTPAGFLVDRELVDPADFPATSEVDGRVRVLVLSVENGEALVEVPGEAISVGPRVLVSSRLVS